MKYGTEVPPGTLLKIKAQCDSCNKIGVIGGPIKYALYKGYNNQKLCRICADKQDVIWH
jgi:hypothetical protein